MGRQKKHHKSGKKTSKPVKEAGYTLFGECEKICEEKLSEGPKMLNDSEVGQISNMALERLLRDYYDTVSRQPISDSGFRNVSNAISSLDDDIIESETIKPLILPQQPPLELETRIVIETGTIALLL